MPSFMPTDNAIVKPATPLQPGGALLSWAQLGGRRLACLLTLLLCLVPTVPLALLVMMALSDSSRQQSKPLMHGAFFAFLSQLSSIGKGFQKVGVKNGLPELSLRRAVLERSGATLSASSLRPSVLRPGVLIALRPGEMATLLEL